MVALLSAECLLSLMLATSSGIWAVRRRGSWRLLLLLSFAPLSLAFDGSEPGWCQVTMGHNTHHPFLARYLSHIGAPMGP